MNSMTHERRQHRGESQRTGAPTIAIVQCSKQGYLRIMGTKGRHIVKAFRRKNTYIIDIIN